MSSLPDFGAPDLPHRTFERVSITGTLLCLSDLHVGNGEEKPVPEPSKKNAAPPLYSAVCLDVNGRPYIPGATLRGFLNQTLWVKARDRHEKIFGTARKARDGGNSAEVGNAGAVRVYDARAIGGSEGWRSRIANDPVTGTAKEGRLFNEAVVLAGSRFRVHLELHGRINGIGVDDVAAVLWALSRLGDSGGALGGGKGHGRGRLRWRLDPQGVMCLSRDALRDWLLGEGSLAQRYEPVDVEPWAQEPANCRYRLRLRPSSPLLVRDPKVGAHEEKAEGEPDFTFMRRGSRVLVPGSTLRGMIRARCRRLILSLIAELNSMTEAEFRNQADKLTDEIFGGKARAGWVRASDAIGHFKTIDQRSPSGMANNGNSVPTGHRDALHRQWFNAVDRFTGGVKGGALYQVEAVWPDSLRCVIHLNPKIMDEPNRWMLGLLTLVLRDAMEGDLALGWGKGRGYGAFKAEIRRPEEAGYFERWRELIADARLKEAMDRDVKALETHLESLGAVRNSEQRGSNP